MRGALVRPTGLVYQPELVDQAEERELLTVLRGLARHDIRAPGRWPHCTIRQYGSELEIDRAGDRGALLLTRSATLPSKLEWVRDRCASLLGVEPGALSQMLVTRYPPGAPIGWHREAPAAGPTVVGLSLAAPCLLRFQRRVESHRLVYELPLAPRSAYMIRGAARSSWQRRIPAVPDLRYSITFRMARLPA